MPRSFTLLTTKRFLPMFIAQFLGAFNDNVFKNAMVILLTYRAAETLRPDLLVPLAAGLFILPFFLFSAMAGQLADKYEKARLVRLIKLYELPCMLLGTYGFYTGEPLVLLFGLFLLGTQAAFFGPVKYGILPELLPEDELIGGNGLVEAGTFLAILIGTMVGGLYILGENGVWIISSLMVGISLIGWAVSFMIPHGVPAAPDIKIGWNMVTETWAIMKFARIREDVFLCIIGISWFWLIGATFLSQFPVYTKDYLHADETVVTLFLTLFSLGIGIGSILCSLLMRGRIHGGYVPWGALGMTVFTFIVYLSSSGYSIDREAPMQSVAQFIESTQNYPILVSLLLLAVCGGIYIVPLYAIMQARTDKSHRARVIASNNVMNALFMVLSSLLIIAMLAMHFTVLDVFITIAIINLPVAWLVRRLVKEQQSKQKERGYV